MYTLKATTETLRAFLGAGADPNVQATVIYYDVPLYAKEDLGDYKRFSQFASVADTTEVTILDAPQQNFVRHIENITIFNADNAAAVVNIAIDDGANRVLIQKNMASLSNLTYERNAGWLYMTT